MITRNEACWLGASLMFGHTTTQNNLEGFFHSRVFLGAGKLTITLISRGFFVEMDGWTETKRMGDDDFEIIPNGTLDMGIG